MGDELAVSAATGNRTAKLLVPDRPPDFPFANQAALREKVSVAPSAAERRSRVLDRLCQLLPAPSAVAAKLWFKHGVRGHRRTHRSRRVRLSQTSNWRARKEALTFSRRTLIGQNRSTFPEQFPNKVPAFSPGFGGWFTSCSSAESGGQGSAWIGKRWFCLGKLVLPDRIELSTSPLPMECSTTELRQHTAKRAAHEAGRSLPQGPQARKRGPCLAMLAKRAGTAARHADAFKVTDRVGMRAKLDVFCHNRAQIILAFLQTGRTCATTRTTGGGNPERARTMPAGTG